MSLYEPPHLTEVEGLVRILLNDPDSLLVAAIADSKPTMAPEQQQAVTETLDSYRRTYGLG